MRLLVCILFWFWCAVATGSLPRWAGAGTGSSGLSWGATCLSDGRIASEQESGSGLTSRSISYTYYSSPSLFAGLLQSVTDGRSTTRNYTYDDYLRLAALTNSGSLAEQQTWTVYQYDRRNLLTNAN